MSDNEITLLEAQLTELQNKKSARESSRRLADLKKKIEAAELDAKAEEIADKLAEDGAAGERGVDFEVATGNGKVFAFTTPPGPAWEKFQSKISLMLTKDEHVGAHEYRNLARASLLERIGEGYEGLASKADFDAACLKHPGMANRVYLILSDLAGGRVERRAGK